VTESVGRSTVDVAVTEVIRRPVEAVARYANDPSNAPLSYATISEVE
jgi:cobalamin biosynthesis protein CobD/CbiB